MGWTVTPPAGHRPTEAGQLPGRCDQQTGERPPGRGSDRGRPRPLAPCTRRSVLGASRVTSVQKAPNPRTWLPTWPSTGLPPWPAPSATASTSERTTTPGLPVPRVVARTGMGLRSSPVSGVGGRPTAGRRVGRTPTTDLTRRTPWTLPALPANRRTPPAEGGPTAEGVRAALGG